MLSGTQKWAAIFIFVLLIALVGCDYADESEEKADRGGGSIYTGSPDPAPQDQGSSDDNGTYLSNVQGRFDPTESTGFYSLPFPLDTRYTDKGTIRVLDFPNPHNSITLERYLKLGERDVQAFGANAGILFSFSGHIDTETLPQSAEDSVRDSSSVYILSVDPLSPDYGQRYPFRWKYTQKPTDYGPANLLVLLPVQGVPMEHGRKYAAVITKRVKDTKGKSLRRNIYFGNAIAENTIFKDVADALSPLREYLDDTGTPLEEIVLGTVYTTIDPIKRMLSIRDHVYGYDLPGIDQDSLERNLRNDNYHFIRGTITIPIYQKGEIPYVLFGGDIEFDSEGEPIVQAQSEIRFAVTVPTGQMPAAGWPFLIYSHGSGGSWTSPINKGVADWLAMQGIALVSIDAPHHEGRNPISRDSAFESFCFYNALNPDSFRDNNVQGAAELMAVIRQVIDLEIPGRLLTIDEEKTDPATFDSENVFFMGHSQGSTVGPAIVAVDPYIKAAFFSGAGGSLMWNILTKTEPFDIAQVARILLQLNWEEGQKDLDEFHPALNVIQHMAGYVDPVDLNTYFHQRPIPGVPVKDVFQAQGITDTYVGQPCHGAFAAAAHMDMISPLLATDAWDRIKWTGAGLLDDEVITGNRESYDRLPVTSVVVQYPAPENGRDGHYVTFEFEAMHRRVACFFRTYLDNGIASVVQNSGDEFSGCY